MSYQTHGFTSGMKLSATAMAEIDAQIAQNETDIGTLNAEVAAVPSERLADLRKLSLRADADTIYLEYGTSGNKELISSISMPDVSSIIACTSLSASGSLSNLFLGDTAQITATRQPNDCNQSIRYQSLDTSVATVSSSGLVTAVGSGSTTIHVACGSYSQDLTVKVYRSVSFVGHVQNDTGNLYYGQTGYQGVQYNAMQFNMNGSNTWITNIPYDLSLFGINPGEKATLTAIDNFMKFNIIRVFKEEEGKEIFIVDRREDNDRYDIFNVTEVTSDTSGKFEYTYTNNGDDTVYIAFTCYRNGYASADLSGYLATIDNYLSLAIGPI